MPESSSDERLVDEPATSVAPREATVVSDETDAGVVVCDRQNPQAWPLSDGEVSFDAIR